ncbi:hypothetical protein AB0H42_04760 [Nocardia sp. NPDC050799]|uniref:hypothetical protein n=1 Tax=Nocardia sp. NPDC050799 TaxID=3154842 RepID=UPI0033E22364
MRSYLLRIGTEDILTTPACDLDALPERYADDRKSSTAPGSPHATAWVGSRSAG